ncbi:TetR/AcrR family transcriptional regulator [Salinibacterium hongtaonis]|uniref:TetR/AcrR family transcriptional regulator n=1 Tax=Homoserinimonas hongtaonis TaxID=2079791 RepID=A0A2U1T0V0_9MICO|nr:TetR/AcrR family transcriptional regulator [Salinibacterium hongtaonis]AWB90035.1 TetR family transcriptional regulator [Salinibacterium hongtaonis]PWB97500.1 TetR/AcrR family transcriptional regulator [Salinibacterium hongtaonis]
MTEPIKQGARERILDAAYDLFSHRGIRDVSVDEIITKSKVAIATFYRHFSSKDELAQAFLNRREQVWTSELIVAEVASRSDSPRAQLLGIFDVFDEWFHRDDFEGDSFVKVLLEMGPEHPLGQSSIVHLNHVRRMIRGLAERAGLTDLDDFALSLHILMKGSIVTAAMGDLDSAQQARVMAERLIVDHTPAD